MYYSIIKKDHMQFISNKPASVNRTVSLGRAVSKDFLNALKDFSLANFITGILSTTIIWLKFSSRLDTGSCTCKIHGVNRFRHRLKRLLSISLANKEASSVFSLLYNKFSESILKASTQQAKATICRSFIFGCTG